ncbi:phospholipase effector Tle1 domain-containing protein [Mycobacterium sp. MMS18-G62]
MRNIVLCFDSARAHPGSRNATNAAALLGLLAESDDQITWYHPGRSSANPRRLGGPGRRQVLRDAQAAITEAYEFLIDCWQPEDRIYMFGVGRGAYCAQSLTRLLGTVGLFPQLMDYVLGAYALPRTRRTPQDWTRVRRLAARLSGRRDFGVPVQYLGLWDAVKLPGLPRDSEPLTNVAAGRHAVAIDGGYGPFGEHLVAAGSDRVEEAWFRGAHCDVAGGPAACQPLAQIALDWVLDGAMRAGVEVRPGSRYLGPAPSEFDALAGSARTISIRKLPPSALVHASVDVYVRAHPEYWRRLPAHVVWADRDWLARSERLVHAEPAAPRVVPAELAAAAS